MTEPTDSEPAGIVLLGDPRVSDGDGASRRRVREAFAATGATVDEVVAPLDLLAAPPAGGRRAVRLARRAGAVLRDAVRRRASGARRIAARLGAAELVVAQTPDVASLALALGVAGRSICVLVSPPYHPAVGAAGWPAATVVNLAAHVGGFLTTDEAGRESIEAVTASTIRPRVTVLPQPSIVDNRDLAAEPVFAAVPAAARVSGHREVLVSGFDLKFIRELAARLDRGYGLRVRLDEWPGIGVPSAQTRSLAARADTIVAEWARPNAAYLARHKRPGQRLVVRLHRYELTTDFPAGIDIDRVDAVVHVSPHVGREIVEQLGWPAEKLVCIPNYVDIESFDRPKLSGARFGVGAIGIELANKRFDLMLDVIAEVRRLDPRFTLFVRSTMPWQNRYVWGRPAERDYTQTWLRRIDADPLLRGGVIFDPPGRDMARWYRKVGVVLSMSDVEGFHMAVAEGMASGAVPVIRPRPGAAEIFGPQWISPTTESIAKTVVEYADGARWEARSAAARERVRHIADPAAVLAGWSDLLHGQPMGMG